MKEHDHDEVEVVEKIKRHGHVVHHHDDAAQNVKSSYVTKSYVRKVQPETIVSVTEEQNLAGGINDYELNLILNKYRPKANVVVEEIS